MTLAFMSFGIGELLLVGVVALLVFGGNLPEVMRQLGRSYGRLRNSLSELTQPVRDEMRGLRRPDITPVPTDQDLDLPDYPSFDVGPEPADADSADGEAPDDEQGPATAPPPEEDLDEPPPV